LLSAKYKLIYQEKKVLIQRRNNERARYIREKRALERRWIDFLIESDFKKFLYCIERGIPVCSLMPKGWR
jgi:hypothetical protein